MTRSSGNKIPEFFWPRQVLRKLLRLKPGSSATEEFNADDDDDDDDNEEELRSSVDGNLSSDSSEVEIETTPRLSNVSSSRTRSLPPLYPHASTTDRVSRQAAGASPRGEVSSRGQSEGASPRGDVISRGQSETLWTHLVDMQDYRIYVGTWNVAGKAPSADLDLRKWLDVDQPADMYVIGFQEIVPLNAGNVLGTADNSPVAKWEALIRRTLNGDHRRTRSAPASPAAVHPLFTKTSPELKPRKSLTLTTKQKDEEEDYKAPLKRGHRRVQSASEQSFSSWSAEKTGLEDSRSFDSSLLLQQLVVSPPVSPCPSSSSSVNFIRIVSKQMVGIYISVWIRRGLRRHVRNVKVCCVGCGLMGYCGNKGSISVSLTLHQTSFCFICTHLTSGDKEGDELRRNADVTEILRRTSFIRSSLKVATDFPETILQHDRVIWLGDLNYRLTLTDSQTRVLVAKQDWQTLLRRDQLSMERIAGRVFEGWEEGCIVFAPTYKYLTNSDIYVGFNLRPGEKRRTPSWCDRILWRGRGLKQLNYVRGECRFSDHRPVSAVFIAEVEVLSSRKLKTVAKVSKSRAPLQP